MTWFASRPHLPPRNATHARPRGSVPHLAPCTPRPPRFLLQPRFRSLWERYCRGVQAIVYVVDAADIDSLESASRELASLCEKPSLRGIPLLVLGNKNDLAGALGTQQLLDRMNLKARPPWVVAAAA